jgi:hypothetical protein
MKAKYVASAISYTFLSLQASMEPKAGFMGKASYITTRISDYDEDENCRLSSAEFSFHISPELSKLHLVIRSFFQSHFSLHLRT